MWESRLTASLHGLPSPVPLIALTTYSTCFTRFYPCYTCLIPLSSHSQPLLLLYLSAWHFALAPHCLAFRLRMSGIALDLSRFEMDFLRNLPPAERIRQEKASGEAWPMPGQSTHKSQTGFGGKEPMKGKEVSLKHLRI